MQTGNRSKRTKIFAGLLSLAVLVSLPRLGWSQRQARVMIRPSVDSIEDAKGQKLDDIVLKHGDRPMIIMVKGKNLHLVKRAQLFLGNTRVQKRNVEVKVVEAKPTQLKLSLQVKTATIQGTGYYLKLQDERQNGLANVKASRFSLGAQLARIHPHQNREPRRSHRDLHRGQGHRPDLLPSRE